MANKDECMTCRNLVAVRRKLSIKRKDGQNEIATAYNCQARNMPLPTITKYDIPGCPYYSAGDTQIVWNEQSTEG